MKFGGVSAIARRNKLHAMPQSRWIVSTSSGGDIVMKQSMPK